MPGIPEGLSAAIADRYRLERELGQGGMATVYLATDRRHDRQVAIKVLHPDLVASTGTERFVREIQIAARLTHPHILPLLDSGEAGGRPYYVMPYVAGESLRARLTRLGPLAVDEALRIAIAVAHALEHAHAQDIVHRDIKPENVLLSSGEPVVADFGIARAVTAAGGDRLTHTGLAIGTPAYMSPEQASGERLVDGRTDVYALAVMVYEMLAGEVPFTGPNAQAISARKVAASPPSVRVIRPAVSAGLDAALRRALAPVPADRFPGAREFAESLELALRESITGATAVPGVKVRQVAREVWRVLATWRTVAVTALLSTGLLLLRPRYGGSPSDRVFHLSLPTGVLSLTDHGSAPVVAISPDGELIAYVTGPGGSGQLWLRRLDAPTATPVREAPHALSPFFSPDGKWLAFAEESRGMKNAVLKKLRLVDGEQFVICPAPDLHGGTWLPGDRIVLGGMNNNDYGLSLVSPEGGKPELIAKPDTARHELYLIYPSALPDGRGVLFTAAGGAGLALSVDALEVGSRKRTLVLEGGGAAVALPDGILVYAAEGALFAGGFDLGARRLAGKPERLISDVLMNLPMEPALGHFAIGREGTLVYVAGDARSFRGSPIFWLDSAGKRTPIVDDVRYPSAAGGGPGTVNGLRSSPTGDRVIFWSYVQTRDTTPIGYPPGNVWMLDVKTGTTSQVFPESRYYWPVWSSDGAWVIAPRAEDTLKATALFRRRADGRGAPERLTAAVPNHFMQPYDVSRDGSLLFYQVTAVVGDPAPDIYVVSLTGDRTPRPILTTAAAEFAPALSPDGRWLAYAAADPGRPAQVFVTDFPGLKRRWQVSFEGADSPAWSPDGRWLFLAVSGSAGDEVNRVRFDPSQDPPTGRPEPFAHAPNISAYSPAPYGRSYDVSPDGRHLLSAGLSTAGGTGRVDTTAVRELSVIVNWRAAIRRALKR